MKLIISANDGSEGAERALAFAADLAKAFNAKLLIVHVSTETLSQKVVKRSDDDGISEGIGREVD